MSGKAGARSSALKIKHKAFGPTNANAPYPSMRQYASKKELGVFQTQLDQMIREIQQEVDTQLDGKR